jgi:hypothetical protein
MYRDHRAGAGPAASAERERDSVRTHASAIVIGAFTLASCVAVPVLPPPSAGTLAQSTTDGIQYRSALPRDVPQKDAKPRIAFGSSCHTTLTSPFSPPAPFYGSDVALQLLQLRQALQVEVGDAGFARAVEEAKRSVHDAPLYDVRVDLHTTSVLSVIRRDCLEVHALAGPDPHA